MTASFFDLKSDGSPLRFRADLDPSMCVGPPGTSFMFGGAGAGLAVTAIERATGQSLVWCTIQFRAPARLGEMLRLEVDVAEPLRSIRQLSATGRVGDVTVFSVLAAAGERPGHPDHQWPSMPHMPPPDRCVLWQLWPAQGAGKLLDRLDLRFPPSRIAILPAKGQLSADGRLEIWVRATDDVAVDAALLAVFADLIPSGVAAALGRLGGGNSLDNTLRIRRIVATDWVACVVRVQSVDRGFAHADIELFAEDGTLMATGSQTLVLRDYAG